MKRFAKLRASIFAAALPLSLMFGGHAALASDPYPGDEIAPPPNVNIGVVYNFFADAGTIGAVHGSNYTHSTRISTDITVARYIRTFTLGGYLAGVQAFEPYVAFLGTQQAGFNNIPGISPGHFNLSHTSGFAQPNFGAFIFPVNNPKTGTYLVIGPWIAPPVSSFNKNNFLNPAQNVWTYEMEVGAKKMLIGTPSTPNLSIVAWGEVYLYGQNNQSALVTPEIFSNAIPFPLVQQSSTPATFKEQPTEEFRVYLPYEFYPATGATVTPGFFQSFGGKQTYTLRNGFKVDSGSRTNETQARLFISSFLSPTTQITLAGYYDIQAHGQPLNRQVQIRFVKFF